METGPRFKVSSERLEKPVIELTTPGLEGLTPVVILAEYLQPGRESTFAYNGQDKTRFILSRQDI